MMNLETSSQPATYSFPIKQVSFIILSKTYFFSQALKTGMIPLPNPTEKNETQIITINTCLSTTTAVHD